MRLYVIRLLFLSLWSLKHRSVQKRPTKKMKKPNGFPTWAARYKESAGNIVDKEMHLMVRSTWRAKQTLDDQQIHLHSRILTWNLKRSGTTSTNHQFLSSMLVSGHYKLKNYYSLVSSWYISFFKKDFIILLWQFPVIFKQCSKVTTLQLSKQLEVSWTWTVGSILSFQTFPTNH